MQSFFTRWAPITFIFVLRCFFIRLIVYAVLLAVAFVPHTGQMISSFFSLNFFSLHCFTVVLNCSAIPFLAILKNEIYKHAKYIHEHFSLFMALLLSLISYDFFVVACKRCVFYLSMLIFCVRLLFTLSRQFFSSCLREQALAIHYRHFFCSCHILFCTWIFESKWVLVSFWYMWW